MLCHADVAVRRRGKSPVARRRVMVRLTYIALRQIYCAARLPSCASVRKRPQEKCDSTQLSCCGAWAGREFEQSFGQFRRKKNITAAGLFRPRRKRQDQGETFMAMLLQNTPQNPSDARASNEMIKLIRKLRWIGMDEEAHKLQKELTQRETAAEDSVVATPGETD